MTLVIAYTRKVGVLNELVVVSDSRLRLGGYTDFGPKVFNLGRGDSVIAFAGDTTFAYPIIHHLISATNHHPRSKDRSIDLPKHVSYLIKIVNSYIKSFEDADKLNLKDSLRGLSFLIGGWSWERQRIRIWKISWRDEQGEFTVSAKSTQEHGRSIFLCIGDDERGVRAKLVKLREQKQFFDYEPLDLLHTRASDSHHLSVGGTVQLFKVYPHPNVLQFAVRRTAAATISLGGRDVFDFERTTLPIYTIDTGKIHYPLQSISQL